MPLRYAQGSPNWLSLYDRYGENAANNVAAAEASGGNEAVNALLSDLNRGNSSGQFDTRGTWELFYDQITTDPLGAPLDAANNTLGNTFKSVFRNPLVILAVVAVIFFALGGGSWLARQGTKALAK